MEGNIAKLEIVMGLTCKICTTCYPNRKKPLITKKA